MSDPLTPAPGESSGDVASRIMAAIAALPSEAQADAIHSLINGLIHQLPYAGILQMRAEIAGQFAAGEVPIVTSTLEVIDGHLILRELGEIEEPNVPPPSPLP